MYGSIAYSGQWDDSFSFTFLAGTTVSLTATIIGTIPVGASVDIYAGETVATMIKIESGVKTALLFLSAIGGATPLYVRLVLNASSRGDGPIITSLALLIEQSTSLYTIATQILADGLTPSGTDWDIDTELQKYPIPYAWVSPVAHRVAIGSVAEAAGGVVFQDRLGIIRVQAGNFIGRDPLAPNLFTILANRIYNASSPVSEVKNRIQIKTSPYVALAETTVWTLTGDTAIDNGESRTFDIRYTDYDAIIDGHAVLSSAPAGASITSETHYSWGCALTILGSSNAQVLTLVIHGKPLVLQGSQLIERTDGASIRRNGDKALTIDANNMIQSEILAGIIADDIIEITANESRDIELEWRGDPSIELGDKGSVLGFNSVIVTQGFEFNGVLRATAQLRKVT
jgi:hypothetical protein